ncbi:MAG: redoxin domain-containing protein [Bacteroidales bacterium]
MSLQKSIVLIVLAFFLGSCNATAQQYAINIKINGLSDAEIFLAHHYGNKQYLDDTIKLNNKGEGIFKGDSLLHQGIYLVVLPSKNYFEMVVGSDQQFSIETTMDDLQKSMKVKGSKENLAFLHYQNYMIAINTKSMDLQQRLKTNSSNTDSTEFLQSRLKDLDKEVRSEWNKIIAENPGTLLESIIKAMISPEMPEFVIPENVQNKDSAQWFMSYNYNQNHYFDNVNLHDERLLLTPILHNKIDHYFTKILIQNPDTIIKYIDILAQKASGNDEVFQYLMRYCINTFQQSNIMGMDKVFVHVADTYYLSGKVNWLDEETMKKLGEQVAKLRFNLVGNVAQDLKMETLNGQYARLSEIKANYTLVMFYEPDCGHCKKVVPKIWEIYNQFNRNEFEVFAVYTQTDKAEWMKYMEEKHYDWINAWDPYNLTNFRFFYNVYSTPTLYLLDKDKKIIAKRIGPETVENILNLELGKKKISEIDFTAEEE